MRRVIGWALSVPLVAATLGWMNIQGPAPHSQFSATCDGWSNFTGTAASHPSKFTAAVEDEQHSLVLKSPDANSNHDLKATCTFTITWRPLSQGELPPATATVEVMRSSQLRVWGNGYVKIVSHQGNPPEILDEKAGAIPNDLNGWTQLPTTSHTVTLTPQPDGTATGSLAVVSDTVSTQFNSTTSEVTEAEIGIGIFTIS